MVRRKYSTRLRIICTHKTGLARSTVTQLYHDKAKRIDYDTVEKLCTLFNCEISDLFILEEKNKEMDGKNIYEF